MFRAAALALLATLTHGEMAQPQNSHKQERRRRLIGVTSTDQTASELANSLVGGGVTVSDATLICDSLAYGTFSNAGPVFGISDGIILSSGAAVSIEGPNDIDSDSTNNGFPGDVDLSILVGGGTTLDACSLEFDFSCDSDPKGFSFSYVFSSEEYNEYVFSEYNDVFGFFLDGKNIALIPGTTTPVSINTVNCGIPYNPAFVGTNCDLFINNDLTDGAGGLDTQADGFTVPLSVSVPSLSSGMHHIKLAIADVGDNIWDSHVLIQAGSLVCAPPPEPCTYCDFDELTVFPASASDGKVANGTVNGIALLTECGMTVTPYKTNANMITVLDSEDPVRNTTNRKYDPDLGSPNIGCGGVGRGTGGKPGKTWQNCAPLGNVLILQDATRKYPNDNMWGGCMKFTFVENPVTNLTLGLLDIDSTETANITLVDVSGISRSWQSAKTGDNGYWTSDSPKNTNTTLLEIILTRHVTELHVCLSGSGAVTHVNYCNDPYMATDVDK